MMSTVAKFLPVMTVGFASTNGIDLEIDISTQLMALIGFGLFAGGLGRCAWLMSDKNTIEVIKDDLRMSALVGLANAVVAMFAIEQIEPTAIGALAICVGIGFSGVTVVRILAASIIKIFKNHVGVNNKDL